MSGADGIDGLAKADLLQSPDGCPVGLRVCPAINVRGFYRISPGAGMQLGQPPETRQRGVETLFVRARTLARIIAA